MCRLRRARLRLYRAESQTAGGEELVRLPRLSTGRRRLRSGGYEVRGGCEARCWASASEGAVRQLPPSLRALFAMCRVSPWCTSRSTANGADSSAQKSAAAVHSSAQSLKDSVRSALMTGRTVFEAEHARAF